VSTKGFLRVILRSLNNCSQLSSPKVASSQKSLEVLGPHVSYSRPSNSLMLAFTVCQLLKELSVSIMSLSYKAHYSLLNLPWLIICVYSCIYVQEPHSRRLKTAETPAPLYNPPPKNKTPAILQTDSLCSQRQDSYADIFS
jgi:hypothetical protein